MRRRVGWVLAGMCLTLAGCRAARTQVNTFSPTTAPAGATQEGGSCWTHSIAAPARADAWRCSIGNSIEDPCFELAGSTGVLCGADPARPKQAHPILLQLNLPLPEEALPAGARTQPWLVELKDGATCRPFTGTRPLAANQLDGTYACSDGTTIFGALQQHGDTPWTARVGKLKPAPGPLPSVTDLQNAAVRAVWQ